MRKTRTTVAALVAIAVLSTGSTACTPQQTQGAFNAIGSLFSLILYAWASGQSHPAPSPSPPTTAPPVTVPEPVAS